MWIIYLSITDEQLESAGCAVDLQMDILQKLPANDPDNVDAVLSVLL